MNFGQERFQFDVLDYELSLRRTLNRPELYFNLALSRLSPRVLRVHQENFSLSPNASPQPASSPSHTSSSKKLISRFASNSLLHRSLRIIDAQTYKFQVPFPPGLSYPALAPSLSHLSVYRVIFSLTARARMKMSKSLSRSLPSSFLFPSDHILVLLFHYHDMAGPPAFSIIPNDAPQRVATFLPLIHSYNILFCN
jgi:hypothetical protein